MNGTLQVFTAASHNDILALITQIAVLLFTARLFSEIAQRLKQPSVIGELLAGIILGPSCLGKIFPFFVGVVIPANPVQGYLLEAIALIGAMFLLLVTGLETDLNLIRRHARTALGVSFGGILVTFSSGFLLGQLLPDFLLPAGSERLIFALFIATAMSISAIPVIAKVLMDLKLMRRDIGQTIIAAGMSDDTIGWILLSIVAGLASGKVVSLGTVFGSIGTVIAFMVLSFTAGKWFVKKAIDFVQDEVTSPDRLLTLAVVLTFAWGSITQILHLEPVLGAFVMGILLGQMPRLPQSVHQKLHSIAISIFAPIFFAVAGLKVNALNLLEPKLLTIAFTVILFATVGKVTGTYLGARLIGRRGHWTALSFGAALNARGAMEIIVATIGLSLGILSQEMFSIIVLMAMVTSLMAPFALRYVLRNVKPDKEEVARLKQEELAHNSPMGNIHRVLVPIRRRENEKQPDMMQILKSRILQKMAGKTRLSITLLTADKKEKQDINLKFLNELNSLFSGQELVTKNIVSQDPVNSILDEAQKDYDLLLLGGSEPRRESDHLFSAIIDSLVSLSPITTMVVKAKNIPADWTPKNILIPTNGSLAAKHAAELAFLISSAGDEKVTILNVLEKNTQDWSYDINSTIFRRQMKIAERIVEELRELGEAQNIETMVDIQVGADPETAILNVAQKENIDLIILGTDVRPASDRLFLGPRVELIIKSAPCPVIVLNSI